MAQRSYTPDRGDIIWLNFYPQAGREQKGRRPALVLSPKSYNQRTGLVLCCPITSRARGHPFEVRLPASSPVHGVVLSDQIRNLDWRARNARFKGRAPRQITGEAIDKALVLLT